jgi:outer membrane protein assembly factor BamA
VVDVLGKDGMVSVPLTWGGTTRAAIELDKHLNAAPITRIQASVSASSRDNPFFDVGDKRSAAAVDLSRAFRNVLNAGVRAGWASVRFGALHDHLASYGVRLSLDNRSNPAFPRNAVVASVAWDRLDPRHRPAVNTLRADFRAYVGLVATSVVALRGVYESADGPLPPYEKVLLGGAENLRGFRAGSFAGDNLLAASVEVRVPTTSPMRFGQSGVVVFADAGSVWNHGQGPKDAMIERGFGAGWYLVAPFVRFNADLGYGVGKGLRLHVVTGLKF